MILRYRVQSDENENFVLDVDVPHTLTLLEFNDFLLREVGYEPCMTSIFPLSPSGQRGQEYTCMDMGVDFEPAPILMSRMTIGGMVVADVRRMELLFDNLENRSFNIVFLERIDAVPGLSYPRVCFSNSEAPNQYDSSIPVSSTSIFDEMMEGMDVSDGNNDASEDEW